MVPGLVSSSLVVSRVMIDSQGSAAAAAALPVTVWLSHFRPAVNVRPIRHTTSRATPTPSPNVRKLSGESEPVPTSLRVEVAVDVVLRVVVVATVVVRF